MKQPELENQLDASSKTASRQELIWASMATPQQPNGHPVQPELGPCSRESISHLPNRSLTALHKGTPRFWVAFPIWPLGFVPLAAIPSIPFPVSPAASGREGQRSCATGGSLLSPSSCWCKYSILMSAKACSAWKEVFVRKQKHGAPKPPCKHSAELISNHI